MRNLNDYITLTDYVLSEGSIDNDHLELDLLDPDEFIKKNPSTKPITSSIFFTRLGSPNPEGLLSNEIFGLTKEERSGIYGYIDLHEYFINPLIYKKLVRLDRKFREIVHGTKFYTISSSGELVEDPEKGKTGLKWLKSNFDNIKIKVGNTETRKKHVKFINQNRKLVFMNKLLVLPAYYRDVNTEQGGRVSVGEINEIYANIISNVKGITDTQDYGLDITDSIKGRIQEGILAVYDWICGNTNNLLEGSTGLSQKMGIIRRAGMSKTTDYGSRLVLSAPELKVETIDDMMVDIKHSAVPLASLLANFLPFIIFQVKRWLDMEFSQDVDYYEVDKGEFKSIRIDDYQLQFSDDVIKEKIENFIHGYSNRLEAFTIVYNGKPRKIKFTGRHATRDEIKSRIPQKLNIDPMSNLTTGEIDRVVTWCDIFYMAAVEVTKDKCVIITRYPIDSMYNQFPAMIVVASTKETEPMYYNGEFYQYYPKIRSEDIGSNTSNKFVDTLRISNLLLKAICGDYDGDQVSVKGVFTKEANEECIKYINSKLHYIGMDGANVRTTTNEAVQSAYTLTMIMESDKKYLKDPTF